MSNIESRKCGYCNEVITKEKNWKNTLFFNELYLLKIAEHMEDKHEMNFKKGKRVLYKRMVFKIPRKVIGAILWIVTLPFWIIHEIASII